MASEKYTCVVCGKLMDDDEVYTQLEKDGGLVAVCGKQCLQKVRASVK